MWEHRASLIAERDGDNHDKMYNFIGMDYVGNSEASLNLINFIVHQNQIPYVGSLAAGATASASAVQEPLAPKFIRTSRRRRRIANSQKLETLIANQANETNYERVKRRLLMAEQAGVAGYHL